ncbi:hypothetical protein Leryth_013240 [Lithospermum erythrorhizon]|nr:hypothetical protein Leryth_013240 [Lithospermum erythrorhizon]
MSSKPLHVIGPALDLPYDLISSVFGSYGQIKGVYAADETGTRVVVSFDNQVSATSAMEALNARNCPQLNNRFLHIRYSVQSISPIQANDSVNVSLEASELGIPGLYLVRDIVSDAEEKELLAAVDCRPWHCLAKRRVQHYGYEFCYNTRNVDTNQYMGELPSFVSPILERVERFENLGAAASLDLDQLTVC